MADRTYWTGVEATGPDGRALTAKQGEHFNTLFNSIILRPTVVSNVGNDYTATIDPPLNPASDVVPPMSFVLKPNADNSGTVRLRIGAANPYYNVVKANGENFNASEFRTDTNYFLTYLDGQFYSLSDANLGNITNDKYKYVLTSSGVLDLTLIKAAKHVKTRATVQMWGGGGGGSRVAGAGGGGGGGAFVEFETVLEDLPNLVSYTIGAGGAGRTGSNGAGTIGGNTTFNGAVTAFGGANGASSVITGGGGGGEFAVGVAAGAGGAIGGGSGAVAGSRNATTIFGGGGGGGSTVSGSDTYAGGFSVYGGGGGGAGVGGGSTHIGGSSKFGGAGGNGSASATASNGVAPGGGGGGGGSGNNGGNGARGEIRVYID